MLAVQRKLTESSQVNQRATGRLAPFRYFLIGLLPPATATNSVVSHGGASNDFVRRLSRPVSACRFTVAPSANEHRIGLFPAVFNVSHDQGVVENCTSRRKSLWIGKELRLDVFDVKGADIPVPYHQAQTIEPLGIPAWRKPKLPVCKKSRRLIRGAKTGTGWKRRVFSSADAELHLPIGIAQRKR
jgi:hypothetical protein